MTKILYPLEEPSQLTALPLLKRLAASRNATVKVLEAYGEGPDSSVLVEQLRQGGVQVDVESADQTNLAETVRDLCEREAIDLTVVLGKEKSVPILERALGETSEDLIDASPTDLLVATASQVDEMPPLREVLVPIDFSEASRRSLVAALDWIESGGRVTLLYVVPDSFPLFNGTRGLDKDYFDKETLEANWRPDLEAFWAQHGRTDLTADYARGEGDWETAVSEAAREGKHDLVVVGENDGLGRGLAERLASATEPCPVLIARSVGSAVN